jgi:hypothetical protein
VWLIQKFGSGEWGRCSKIGEEASEEAIYKDTGYDSVNDFDVSTASWD